ncbi:restriction endonuclease subunit S [Nonlabens spongiae]|uniref:Restriction endonuclease subunit S n=1 Tax=Nonlabens spongiae TaxID=331648 RepID=A0A1W6MPA6_9FLAO|nr:restriction endonuclease subunit S [Nonlabens spongiae]
MSVSEENSQRLSRLEAKKERLDQLRPFPSAVVNNIRESLDIEWIHSSNSIEGNTLTLKETQMVIQDGITVSGKTLREHFEAVNHKDAIEYIEQLISPNYTLRERDVLNVHELIMDKIDKEFAGRLRNAGVRISGAQFLPPNARKVPDLLEELIDWVANSQDFHPIVQAAIFHHRFVYIHPFFDGNGRTVRLLFNLLLMKEGYPPGIILASDRKRYYKALKDADQGNLDKLLELTLQAVTRSTDIYLNNLEDIAGDFAPISDIVKEPAIPYGQEYVSLLARKGQIDAYKEGRVWFTSKDAITKYLKSKGKLKN